MADLPGAVEQVCRSPEFTLDDTQTRAVVRVVAEARSTWIKGRAGSGKSRTLAALKAAAELRERKTGKPFHVQLCATTNNAAQIVGGDATTLHRFLGISVARDSAGAVGEAGLAALKLTQVLVVDEASMLHPELFRSVHQACTTAGTALVVVGDFQQLPPVHTAAVPCNFVYAYQTPEWAERFPAEATINFNTIYRQGVEHAEFLYFLACLRRGELNDRVKDFVRQRCVKSEAVPEDVLRVYGRVADVAAYNASREVVKADETRAFVSRDTFFAVQDQAKLAAELPGQSELVLYTGLPVIVVANLKAEDRLVVANGAMGKVHSFLRWEAGEMQLATASSPEAKEMTEAVVVKLAGSGKKVLVPWHLHTVKESNGAILAKRLFMPLIPAYAITAHRVQGMTLHALAVHMKSMWARNMLYMACARVRDPANLFFFSEGNPEASLGDVFRAVLNVRQDDADREEDEDCASRPKKRARPDDAWTNPFEDD